MNKKVIIYLFPVIILFFLFNPQRSYSQFDSIAVSILDSMSDRISQLETCSFKFYSEIDKASEQYGLITHSEFGTVFLRGPDRLLMEKKGDKGHKKFYYNGTDFLLYSFDKNQYASVPASLTLIELIDSVSSHYGVEFPGADVFYPDFVDNILENSNNLVSLGLTMVGEQECFHVAGTSDDMTFQFWVSADGKYLPMKMMIDYILRPETPRYRIVFADWKLNESMSDEMFEFSPPQGAVLIKISK